MLLIRKCLTFISCKIVMLLARLVYICLHMAYPFINTVCIFLAHVYYSHVFSYVGQEFSYLEPSRYVAGAGPLANN